MFIFCVPKLFHQNKNTARVEPQLGKELFLARPLSFNLQEGRFPEITELPKSAGL